MKIFFTKMTAVAKVDLKTLKDFQRELHSTSDKDEEITTNFSRSFRKTTWYTQIPVKMKCVSDKENLIFTVYDAFDYLNYTNLIQKLPALKVKDKFKDKVRICWPHNVGHNIIQSAVLKFDEDIIQTIDSVWLDIYSQFYMKPGFRDHYNLCIGNVPFLEEWSTYLPSYKVNVPQPWYYSKDLSMAIPLFLCSLIKITHHYKLRDKLIDLLRMQVYDDKKNDWKNVPCNLKYLEGVNSSGTLELPELWGRYSYLTDDEREWNKCSTERTYYYDDVATAKALNPVKIGENVSVDLDCSTPCKALFWVAENLTSNMYRNFSNYTTDSENLYKGWKPITTVSLNYGGSSRIEEMESDHFDMLEPYHHFPSPPLDTGYGCYSFANDSTSLDAEIGIIMSGLKAKLLLQLNGHNPLISNIEKETEERDEDENFSEIEELKEEVVYKPLMCSDKFMIHVRMLLTRKLQFTYNQDRKGFTFSTDVINHTE